MKKMILAAVVVSGFVLQGCTSGPLQNFGKYETGTYIDQAKMDSLHDHQTTEAQVITSIGHPDNRQFAPNGEIWSFGYTKISSFGGDLSESTVFEFDKKGVLRDHYKTKGNGTSSSNPLLKAAGM